MDIIQSIDAPIFALIGITLFAGMVRGFTGFGSALILVPVLAVFYDPKVAVVAELIIEIPMTIWLTATATKSAEKKTVVPMVISILIAIPIGVLTLKYFDSQIM